MAEGIKESKGHKNSVKKRCEYCGKEFLALHFAKHQEACRRKMREKVKREHGYTDLKKPEDYIAELNYQLYKSKLVKEERDVELGFTKDFLKFLGIGIANDYYTPLQESVRSRMDMIRKRLDSTAAFYTPIDDLYGTPSGGDTWYEYGRVPVSHLMALTSKRIGVAWRACNGTANDIFRNKFDFVKDENQDVVVKNDTTNLMIRWMRLTHFWTKAVDMVDFDHRTGLGHIVVDKYQKEARSAENLRIKNPGTRPEKLQSFSVYYMTPFNIYENNILDYDKQEWWFRAGLRSLTVHPSRKYVLEMRREELGLRGLALPELCWVSCMAYLNVQYYLLKSLAQLGLVTIGVISPNEYPTPTEFSKTLELLNKMKANHFYMFGRGAQFQIQNAAAQIGAGVRDFMEFLKEDMSSAWIFPKNELFGRAEGGGLEGAGALISKENYLASNIATKQLNLVDDLMYIFTEVCNFSGLEGITIRFNIDMHKSEEQRLKEQIMKEQLEQTKVLTEQAKLGYKLYKQQIKLQMEMVKTQLEMDPKKLMQMSNLDEKNLEGIEENLEKEEREKEGVKTPKPGTTKDFIERQNYLKARYLMLQKHYNEIKRLREDLTKENQVLKRIYYQNDFAARRELELARKGY